MAQLAARSEEFPPSVIASWPLPNYVNPARRGPAIYIVNSIFLCIATVAVVTRIYTRLRIRNWFGLDDAFILLALVAASGVMGCVLLGFHKYAWDRHIYDMPLQDITASGKLLYVSKIIWSIASSSVRFSVTVLYYRLLDHIGLRKYRWILHINTTFMAALLTTQLLLAILTCLPVSAMWTWPQNPNAKCIDNGKAMLSSAILNTLSEFILALLPVPIVLTLHMTRAQRWTVVSLLSLGFFVSICGAVRCYYLWMTIAMYDPTWWAMPHWIVSEVEIDTAIICACVPALRPMLGRLVSRGPAAAWKPNLNESGRPRSGRLRPSRSLFSGKASEDSSKLNSFSTPPSTQQYQTIDLEGIANDGFGYTVTITALNGAKKRKRWSIRHRRWSQDHILEKEDTPIQVPPRTQSVMKRGSALKKHRSRDMALDIEDKQGIEVMTRNSFEIRESFHSGDLRGWDPRNTYIPPEQHEEDIEIGIERAASRLTDWSLLNDDVPAKKVAHFVDSEKEMQQQHHRRQLSNSSHTQREHRRAPSLIAPRPDSRASGNRHVHMKTSLDLDQPSHNRLPSQDTTTNNLSRKPSLTNPRAKPTPTFPRVVHAQRMNTPSPPLLPPPPAVPPPGRLPRSVSPVVQPLNSSQWWASSPQSGLHRSRSRTSPLNSDSNAAGTHNAAAMDESSWSGALEVVISSAWDQGRTGSYNSSISARDGSRESLVDKDAYEKEKEKDRDEGSSGDDKSFELPIEMTPSGPGPGSGPGPKTGQLGFMQRGNSRNRGRPGTAGTKAPGTVKTWITRRPDTAV